MRSYLVVGNQTLDSPELAEAVRQRTGPARRAEWPIRHIVDPEGTKIELWQPKLMPPDAAAG